MADLQCPTPVELQIGVAEEGVYLVRFIERGMTGADLTLKDARRAALAMVAACA